MNSKLLQQKSKQSIIIPKKEETKQKEEIPEKPKPNSKANQDLIFNKSLCCNDPEEKAYFNEIMGGKKFRTELRYRGSRDGWYKKDFHRMSDGLGPTATLFKIKDNN